MSKYFLIILALLVTFGSQAQSNNITGTLLPSKKEGAVLILPANTKNIKAEPKKYDKRGNEIKIPQSIYQSVKVVTTTSNKKKNYGSSSNNQAPQTINTVSTNNNEPSKSSPLTTNWIASNSDNTASLTEVVDTIGGLSDEVPSLLTPVLKKYEQPKQNVVKETLNPAKVYPGSLAKQGLGLPATTKLVNGMPDLAPINPADVAVNNQYKKTTTTPNTQLIDLLPIDTKSVNSNVNTLPNTLPPSKSKQNIGMPDLMPIESDVNTNSSVKRATNGMIDLDPIEGSEKTGSVKTNSIMPDLAPIEQDEYKPPTLSEIEAIKNTSAVNSQRMVTPEKGLQLPKGTVLASQLGLSYIVKPMVPRVIVDSVRIDDNQYQNFKPKAGGGFGMIDLAPIEQNNSAKAVDNTKMIDLDPIVGMGKVESNQTKMIDLAPIEANSNQGYTDTRVIEVQYQQQSAPVYYQPQPRRIYAKSGTKQKKWTQPPCPCPVPKKKWYPPKKRTYSYIKPAPQQPATVVKYIDRPRETIIYVPVQQQKVEYKQPVQAPPPQQAPKERVVYTDYTNTYKKNETYNKTCNCNQPSQGSGSAPKDPSQYYNPANYVGLNAGPTSGDYPVNASQDKNANVPLQYTFYVNRRGEYSVSVFNNYASVLLGQNGRIVEYKINDQQSANNSPKFNYFGGAESVGGIPIQYNYNRTVNSIGDLKITYDFEGFIKTIGGSQVLYNSRSRIAQVDNIFVNYSNLEAVNVSPPNNGRVVLTN